MADGRDRRVTPRAAPRAPQGARRQHALRDLPRARPRVGPAGHRPDRRAPRPPPEHGAPAPRAHARGRPARGGHRRPRRGRPAAAPLLARPRRAGPRLRAARLPRAGPHAAAPGRLRRPARRRRRRRRPRAGRRRPPRRLDRSLPCEDALAGRAGHPRLRPRVASPTTRASRIGFTHCPFRELAEANPELVCGLHRGLVEGFVAARGGGEVPASTTWPTARPARSRSRARPGSIPHVATDVPGGPLP